MFDALNKFFRDQVAPVNDEQEDARRLRVATAALLLEAAHADSDFSADERQAIEGILAERFSLNDNEAAALIERAETERDSTDDLYEFARRINDEFPRERKLAIVQLLWRVVWQDGVLEAHEDALMHKIGRLLGVRHEELMALKIQVKRGLSD